ncbi:SpoIID/LytB domain-containing protein [Agathobaculum sp. NTUH-O15-33]|uniref:SpoIID/LytB domain-containing protein n=1 Tax=Agathobaculum sp. NTUH-O15-33 TaxID=3079302 RepID=UPI002958AC95|nr:SpoIID/LytB domain-containing protein [Agathobaculum sp. NTUH-O15-33]WNX86556.1 SpoIID/LytB domain-containing protein [Agathobaculum sp. NTUH-O15-33]
MKRFLSMLLSCTLAVGLLSAVPASAVDTDITLRVGLFYESTALPEAKLENVDTAGYTAGKYDGMTFVPDKTISNKELTVKIISDVFTVTDTISGETLYTSAAGADNLAIRPNSELTWCKGYKWRGDFVYRKASNGNVAVINYVGLEDYVKGVLPYEVSADWPIEALKAQAVCARSFALGTLDKHASYGFDVCNTTNCQVYKGANLATDNSDHAVDQTKGEYLTYGGKLAVGYFFSSDGGATEDAKNVWGGDYPYLKGKIDPYEDVKGAQNGVWSVTLTPAEVQQKLIAAGHMIGEVASVAVTKRTATDNVNEVTVTDTTGKQVTITKDAVRSVFGLNSIRYTITPNVDGRPITTQTPNITQTADTLPKTEPIKISATDQNITLNGKAVAPQGYNINDYNYFKLRDLAYLLSGTSAQFNVVWNSKDNQIELASKTNYEKVGGEMTPAEGTVIKNCTPSDSTILLDGKKIELDGYRVNGNNYYKVRDVGEKLGFGVDWDKQSQTVLLTSALSGDPESPDDGGTTTPETPTAKVDSYTFNGTGWGHSVGMSQYGALAMAKKGYDYDEILSFYFTDIEIKK